MLQLFICSLVLCAFVPRLGSSTATSSSSSSTMLMKISPEIVDELKDFGKLIPQATIDELIAKHYIIDGNFREALKYLRSAEFKQLLERAQQVPEIIDILRYLHLLVEDNNNETCERPSEQCGSPQVDIVLLDAETNSNQQADASSVPSAPLSVDDWRTFSSFVEELMQHLPRNDYAQLINQKRQKSAAFAQFYAALRSAQFQPMVDAALKTANVIDVLKPLGANDIDVKSLEATAFKVISWGPAV